MDCIDGIDNDGDGYIDGNDPGCEASPHHWDEAADAVEGYITQCSDGEDNDNDTLVDADDPGCVNPNTSDLDGHLDDESAQ